MPIPVIVMLSVAAFLFLLLALRIRVVLTADDTDVRLLLRVLCFTFPLYPKGRVNPRKYSPRALGRKEKKQAAKVKRKAAKAAKKAAKKKKSTALAKSTPPPHEPPMTVKEKLVFIRRLLAALLRATGKHLHLRAARLHVRVATGDAATTAIAFGAVSGAVSLLLAVLDRFTVLRATPPDVTVFADYLSERSRLDARFVFSMRIWGALCVLFSVAIAFLRARRAPKEPKSRIPENSPREKLKHK